MALSRQQLLAKHDEAERKADWFQFLRHAFDGSGGFAPLVAQQTTGGTGAAPIMPSWWDGSSYLLKHEGEEEAEWYSRILAARYSNHPRRMAGHWLGLLLRRPPTRASKGIDPTLSAFLTNADGARHSWDTVLAESCTRGLEGGCLALVDRADDRGAQNRAQAAGPAYVTLFDPDCLYDWHLDDFNRFDWAKLVEEIVRQSGPDESPVYYWRCRVWYRETWALYEMTQDGSEEPELIDEGLNAIGEVPIVVLTYKDSLSHELWGYTPANELAQIGLDDYQGLSRHIELLEKQGFAVLERPCREGEEKKIETTDIGPARAVPSPMESSRGMAYVAPPDGPVAAHERYRENDRAEAARALGIEQILNPGGSNVSALTKQYEFQWTNGDLAAYAGRGASYEHDVHRLVMLWDGKSEDQAEAAIKTLNSTWPSDFNLRDKQADVQIATAILELPKLDSVTYIAAVKKARDAGLDLTDEEREKSDKELALMAEAMAEPEPPPPPPPVAPGGGTIGQEGAPPATEPGAAPFDGGKPQPEKPIPA